MTTSMRRISVMSLQSTTSRAIATSFSPLLSDDADACAVRPHSDSSDYPGKGGPVRTNAQHYQDMVAYNDKLIGKFMSKLDELDLTKRTLILFLGDNGTPAAWYLE